MTRTRRDGYEHVQHVGRASTRAYEGLLDILRERHGDDYPIVLAYLCCTVKAGGNTQ